MHDSPGSGGAKDLIAGYLTYEDAMEDIKNMNTRNSPYHWCHLFDTERWEIVWEDE